MKQVIAHVALMVKDYDDALEFYTRKLDFTLLEDTKINEQKRWVLIAPPGAQECSLLLAKAEGEKQEGSIGNQMGGRVSFFLFTDDFWRDFNKMSQKSINFLKPPTENEYGIVAVWEDLYGNAWDLIEPSTKNKGVIRG